MKSMVEPGVIIDVDGKLRPVLVHYDEHGRLWKAVDKHGVETILNAGGGQCDDCESGGASKQ